MTPRQVAGLVGVSTGTVHYWINSGYLHLLQSRLGWIWFLAIGVGHRAATMLSLRQQALTSRAAQCR